MNITHLDSYVCRSVLKVILVSFFIKLVHNKINQVDLIRQMSRFEKHVWSCPSCGFCDVCAVLNVAFALIYTLSSSMLTVKHGSMTFSSHESI